MTDDKAAARAKELAYRYLAVRARSRAELSKYLSKKGVDEGLTESVISDLTRYGFIDDEKFAESFAKRLVDVKGLSRYGVKMELKKKGVPDIDIERALCIIFSEDGEGQSEEAVALRIAGRKAASFHKLDRETARRRLTGFLQRRGFGYEIISRVLRKTLP
jgi:regulatory protein